MRDFLVGAIAPHRNAGFDSGTQGGWILRCQLTLKRINHAVVDRTWADGVDANIEWAKLQRSGFYKAVYGMLAGDVGC